MTKGNIILQFGSIVVYFLLDRIYIPQDDGRIATYYCTLNEFLGLADYGDDLLTKITTRKKTYADEIPPMANSLVVSDSNIITMYSVNSSNIESIGFKDNKLYVKFLNGGIYEYSNVGEDLFEGLKQADSKGSWLHWWLKINEEQYPYRVVNDLNYVVSTVPLDNPGTHHEKGYMTGFSAAKKLPIGYLYRKSNE